MMVAGPALQGYGLAPHPVEAPPVDRAQGEAPPQLWRRKASLRAAAAELREAEERVDRLEALLDDIQRGHADDDEDEVTNELEDAQGALDRAHSAYESETWEGAERVEDEARLEPSIPAPTSAVPVIPTPVAAIVPHQVLGEELPAPHPSHALRWKRGITWCSRCGCFMVRWPVQLAKRAALRPRGPPELVCLVGSVGA